MSFRDRAIEFVESHIHAVIAATAGSLVILAILFVFALRGEARSRAAERLEAAQAESSRILGDELRFPSDPISVPGLQRFRERKQSWSVDEAERWFVPPSPEALNELKNAAQAQIDSILEAVP